MRIPVAVGVQMNHIGGPFREDRRHVHTRRVEDNCPLTPVEAARIIDQQEAIVDSLEKLNSQMAQIQKYMFAGRVVVSIVIAIALSFDWLRDNVHTFINTTKGKA